MTENSNIWSPCSLFWVLFFTFCCWFLLGSLVSLDYVLGFVFRNIIYRDNLKPWTVLCASGRPFLCTWNTSNHNQLHLGDLRCSRPRRWLKAKLLRSVQGMFYFWFIWLPFMCSPLETKALAPFLKSFHVI